MNRPVENDRIAAVRRTETGQESPAGRQITENIILCEDGKYRWSYEYRMMRNPTIFLTVLKVLGLSAGIVALLIFLIGLPDRIRYGWTMGPDDRKVLLIVALVFLGVVVLSYIILAALYGWKYVVLFEMDENGVTHIQLPKQVKKAQAIAVLTTLVGAASGNLTVMGAGMLSGSKMTSTSEWSKVKKVRSRKAFETIHVNSLFNHNQVYAERVDFDFVRDYIALHCVNAKIR